MHVRPALPRDVLQIRDIVEVWANRERNVLLPRDLVGYYEAIQEFVVAVEEDEDGNDVIVGCGALHVMWDNLAEVRTLAVREDRLGEGIGHVLLETLLDRARALGLAKVFCLTFEVEFFGRHGFTEVVGDVVPPDVFSEMLRSLDTGVAEFLDLERVKPNTLGNTRMIVHL